MKFKFIIYATGFDENNGGVIALHNLCHLLNESGEEAYIWPADTFFPKKNFMLFQLDSLAKKVIRKIFPTQARFNKAVTAFPTLAKFNRVVAMFPTYARFNTPLAKAAHLQNAVVIYPEVVSGNPLKSTRVVRWFLNKPRFFNKSLNYGENELYYFYNLQFNDVRINPYLDHKLKIIYLMDDIYKQVNYESRHGTCYIIRKGKGKKIVHDLSGSILIDGLPHHEIADVFNKVEYCISYDTSTMLSKYAAMCGCISIVVPDEGISKEKWRPRIEDRYGVAYGFNDIEWAMATRDSVLENYREQIGQTNNQLSNFIKQVNIFFNQAK